MTEPPGGRPTEYSERDSFHEQTQSVTDGDDVVSATGILSLMPQGEPENIESLAGDLRTYGDTVSETGYDIKSAWGGLTNAYKAPDHQEELYSALDPVADDGDEVQTGTDRAATALETFAGELQSIQRRFQTLYDDVSDFRERIKEDEDWQKGEWLGLVESDEVKENERLIERAHGLLQEYADAEVACADAISRGIPGRTRFESMPSDADDGALDEDVFYHGYDGSVEDMAEEWGLNTADTDYNWLVDTGAAVWDHGVGFVEGVGGAVGAHSSEGWFNASWGDAFTEYHGDNIKELAGLAGLYDRESDSFGWAGFDSMGESWKELAHSVVPWTEWDDRPGYVITTAVLNTVGVVGGAALTATGVGAVVGVPLMAWRGASILDGMGSGPAADGGGGGDGADGGSGSGSSSGGTPAGVPDPGQTPTADDAQGFEAPQDHPTQGDMPNFDALAAAGDSGGSGNGTGAGDNEGGVPRPQVPTAAEGSESQRPNRGGGSGSGSGSGNPDPEPAADAAPADQRAEPAPAENTGSADGSAGTASEVGSGSSSENASGGTSDNASASSSESVPNNRWNINEDVPSDAGQSSPAPAVSESGGSTGGQDAGADNGTASGSGGDGADGNSSDSRSSGSQDGAGNSRTGEDQDVEFHGDRWSHTETAARGDSGSESPTDSSSTDSTSSDSSSQTPESNRTTTATATEVGARTAAGGSDSGGGMGGDGAGGRGSESGSNDANSQSDNRDSNNNDSSNDRNNDRDNDRSSDRNTLAREAAAAAMREDGTDGHPDADRSDVPDPNEVVPNGDPRLPEGVRHDPAAGQVNQLHEAFDRITEMFHRDPAEGVGSQSDSFQRFSDRENAPYRQLYEQNRELFDSLREMAVNDPKWQANSMGDTAAPRSGWELAERRPGDGDGSSNSGDRRDGDGDGDRQSETAGVAGQVLAMSGVGARATDISGKKSDGSRAEGNDSNTGMERSDRGDQGNRETSLGRWLKQGSGLIETVFKGGGDPQSGTGDGGGSGNQQNPETGSGERPGGQQENRGGDASRAGSAAEAVGRGSGGEGGAGKPPVPPADGPGSEGGSGSGSGDNSSSNTSSTRGPSDERWSSKTSEERRRAAEPYLKDLDHSSWDAGVRDFINRLNDPESKGLRDIFYKSDGSRRCTEDSIPIGGKDSTIPKLEKAPDGSLRLKEGEVQTNAVKYLGEKIMTKVEANPKGSMRTIMSALDHVMRKRSYAYSMFRALDKIVQDRKEAFGKDSPEVSKSREFRKPWADKATKLSETVGEIAGHRAVLDRFDGTKWLKYEETVKIEGGGTRAVIREEKLPELAPDAPDSPNPIPIPESAPGSGSGQFDMIYRTKDGGYVVVEAKSNQSTELGSRAIGEGANKYKVKQGTREYFDEIIRLMRERGGHESDIADDIDLKLLEGKVHYVEGKGKHSEKTGYTGESLRFFDLRS